MLKIPADIPWEESDRGWHWSSISVLRCPAYDMWYISHAQVDFPAAYFVTAEDARLFVEYMEADNPVLKRSRNDSKRSC